MRGGLNLMSFEAGQQVIYDYNNRIGTITGKQRGDRWQVKFTDGDNLFIPAEKLQLVDDLEDMFKAFEERRFQTVEDLKRTLYKYRLSGNLTNIMYSNMLIIM